MCQTIKRKHELHTAHTMLVLDICHEDLALNLPEGIMDGRQHGLPVVFLCQVGQTALQPLFWATLLQAHQTNENMYEQRNSYDNYIIGFYLLWNLITVYLIIYIIIN